MAKRIVNVERLEPGEPHRCGYSTAGDWWVDEDGVLQIRVSNLNHERSEHAIIVHEYAEAIQCLRTGVTDLQICEFDRKFEAEREQGLHSEAAEPGDDPRAPYREEHQGATHVERAMCHALDLSWNEHQSDVTKFVL